MKTKIEELLELVKKLPEACLDEAIEKIKQIKSENEKEKPTKACPHCKCEKTNRNGKKDGKQRYYCNECGKTYTDTTNTVMYNSHYGETVWKQVTQETIEGQSIDKTAKKLGLSHEAVFNMRHKILIAMEQAEAKEPTKLGELCELDETYVLESLKGRKIEAGYYRGPRKHGAVAQRAGISQEYIGICAGVERGRMIGDNHSPGAAVSVAVGRSVPEGIDINRIFGKRVSKQTLVMCDGAKGYNVLVAESDCEVVTVPSGKGVKTDGFYHINTVNSFHSFIKERYEAYRGVATKYLNRYGVLFGTAFRRTPETADNIYENLIAGITNSYRSIEDVEKCNLFNI